MWDTLKRLSARDLAAQKMHAPLLDDMVQAVCRLVVLQALRATPLSTSECTGELLSKSFVLTQLLQHWLMSEVRDVLRVVEGGRGRGALVCSLLMPRLARKDTLLIRSVI
jgi:hypothetical protein